MCLPALPPHAVRGSKDIGLIKKPTRVRTNLEELRCLAAKCKCTTKHFQCMGSVKVGDSWVSVAKEAGKYPTALCRKWSTAVALAAAK